MSLTSLAPAVPPHVKPPLGEVPYLPPIYEHLSRDVEDHSEEETPCPDCVMIRDPKQTALMMSLTAIQHGVLAAIAASPGTRINHRLVTHTLNVIGSVPVGPIDVVRVAVAATELKERSLGVVRCEPDSLNSGLLNWFVTPWGEKFLD